MSSKPKSAPSIFHNKKKPIKRTVPAPAQRNITAVVKPQPDETTPKFLEFPITISKRSLEQGLRYHALKFQNKLNDDGQPSVVNPYDAQQFTRPVMLHRRDGNDKLEAAQAVEAPPSGDDKEMEAIKALRAQRQAEKEANKALIAPTQEAAAKPKHRQKRQKMVEDQLWDDQDPKNQERKKLRYEESRPWHLEDFDGKNKWIGTYEANLSQSSILFRLEGNGFRMVPVEKWYKMLPVSRVVDKLTSDQIEKLMQQKHAPPRWWNTAHTQKFETMKQEPGFRDMQLASEQTRRHVKQEVAPTMGDDFQADVDEIDFEYNDEFQDDDEGFIFGDPADEEVQDAEKRIRQEMREANLPGTGFRDENRDYDAEQQKAEQAELAEKKRQKTMKRHLQTKERRVEYDSDSESDDESWDEEEAKEEEEEAVSEPSTAPTTAEARSTPTPGKRERDTLDTDMSGMSGDDRSRKKLKRSDGKPRPSSTASSPRSHSPALLDVPGSQNKGKASPSTFPSLSEIKAAIPKEGILIAELAAAFRKRVGDRSSEFIGLVKQASRQEPGTRLLKLKE